MPLLTPRQADIIALARDTGRLDVDVLASHFGVTPQTIRKDLNQLCEQGLLQRYHGGAMLPSGVANLAYEARRQLATEAKRRIGLRAARLIPNDCSLLINIGTTTEQVATALRAHTGLMVITNNINVVNILQGYAGIEVIVAGGDGSPCRRRHRGRGRGRLHPPVQGRLRDHRHLCDRRGRHSPRLRLPGGEGLPEDRREQPPRDPCRRQLEVRPVRAGAHRPHLRDQPLRHRRRRRLPRSAASARSTAWSWTWPPTTATRRSPRRRIARPPGLTSLRAPTTL